MSITVIPSRHWIPPWALVFAQLSHGGSWILLALVALYSDVTALSGPALAWIHTVALGWITMAALGILIHVVPGFTNARWRFETVARFSLFPFGAGIVLFVLGWLRVPPLVGTGALLMLGSIATYFLLAVVTLNRTDGLDKGERTIARALTVNLTFFFVVCILGAIMSVAIAFGWFTSLLGRLPAIHANLALYGWLTMLVYGVSARTVRPICGVRTRFWWTHVIVTSSVLAGPIVLCTGLASSLTPVVWLGGAILAAGGLCYCIDTLDIVRRSAVPHRPPQAFVAASVCWLVVSLALGAGVMMGKPWAAAYVFVTLVGWIGQMVNAHFFHIGVRLIATMVCGEENETRPPALLNARLSWLSFAFMQTAVAAALYGVLQGVSDAVFGAAAVGFCGWVFMLANSAVAISRARRLRLLSENRQHWATAEAALQ